jgi:hypothetical protein
MQVEWLFERRERRESRGIIGVSGSAEDLNHFLQSVRIS